MFALHRVQVRYPGVLALDDVSLDFARGQVCALIGSSGSGKSTVLRLLIGLVRPTAGEVRVDGMPLATTSLQDIRRRLGYVIQEGGLFPHLSGRDNLALLPRHLGWTRERIAARCNELAERVRLPVSALQRYPAELSGGQRQRVALMRALMTDPPALLLDEPLGALDPIVRHELQTQLRDLFDTLDKTVILVTHDVAEAAWLASRLVLMRDGRVVQDGGIADLQRTPTNDYVRRFLDSARRLPERPA
ncbi:ATP-binding cassette domain-containing protein [Oleiagrimonas soli]|uniref:ABC transporter ATP-binding protein n=1 Tax=Oleiagrimonas soli TaxID=1543381 RepID=A0A099CX99_9GAMM|nr:ATP-binding cassette domain-containing protein [Oleiagrimonas soli]KGI77630.1 ABC transporter ATP-binding protein [Oleiagrimonas soli]MBB6182871.1 osmoprotectant transport system ATP-binding protein [Oleiagrimonas soli]